MGGIAEKPGEEVALESAIQSELEEESHRMEEVERELEEVRQTLPGAPEKAAAAAERAESRLANGDLDSHRAAWLVEEDVRGVVVTSGR